MTSLVQRFRPLWLLLVVVLGCDGGPSGPSAGSLRITVLGLPSGSAAAVTVSGPGGFSQPVTGTQTLSELTPGTYTIVAATVMAGTAEYSANPPSQTVTINGAQASASVLYSLATGNLTVTINGLGTSRTAAVTVTGPGYSQPVTATRTLSGLAPGSYTIDAQNVTASCGATSYTASPTSQSATVTANATANASVTYAPPAGDSLNLCVDGLYLTQSTQNYARTVPLVQSRDAYLRVFVVADRANAAAPVVQVRFYFGAVLQSTITIPPTGLSVPTAVDESSLSFSWDTTVSGALIQPGLRIEAEVDPAGAVAETNETDNVLAAPVETVLTVPTLNVTFVPVRQRGNGLQGRVSPTNADSFLAMTKKMHPIGAVDVAIHAPYTTLTSRTLEADNGNGAWGTILEEIDVLRITENSPRYFYGVVRVPYLSGVAGVAYVSLQNPTPGSGALAALGWDHLPSGGGVAAHELAHNWGRNHAPCGGPSGVDPNYPQQDGSTGTYGLDVATRTLQPPTLSDIMGYCDPKWISDYTYRGVFNYLIAPGAPQLSVASQTTQPCLLVWGHVQDGELVLEPAFQVNTRPSLPARRGLYSLEARADDGTTLFALSFAPNQIADAPGDRKNFVFAVPLSAAKSARLASLRVAGHGREVVSQLQPGIQADSVEVRRAAGGGVGLRWNPNAHPMVMVRDPDTGEVLSLARGGEVELPTSKTHLDVLLSNGVKSLVKRVRVTP
jgi:hypothetical protein